MWRYFEEAFVMDEFTALLGIGLAILIGATSPGPSFLVVSRIATARTKRDGFLASLAMGVGGLCFAVASLLGLTSILMSVPSAYWVLKTLGGIYLIYLGISAWLKSGVPISPTEMASTSESTAPLNSFVVSFVTQVSNPKALVIYTGIFATFLPPDASIRFGIIVCFLVFVIETGWYTFVVTLLSTDRSRRVYLSYKSGIERLSGSILGFMGARLLLSTETN